MIFFIHSALKGSLTHIFTRPSSQTVSLLLFTGYKSWTESWHRGKRKSNWQISANAKYCLTFFKEQSIAKDLLLITVKQIHFRSPQSMMQCEAASQSSRVFCEGSLDRQFFSQACISDSCLVPFSQACHICTKIYKCLLLFSFFIEISFTFLRKERQKPYFLSSIDEPEFFLYKEMVSCYLKMTSLFYSKSLHPLFFLFYLLPSSQS